MDARSSVTLVFALALAVFIGVLAARSQPQTTAAPAPTAAPTRVPTPLPNHVNIEPNPSGNPLAVFAPATLTVAVGQKVTWVNLDTVDHSVIADDGAFNTGVLSPGEQTSWRPRRAGTYSYGDFLHPDLHGVLVVRP